MDRKIVQAVNSKVYRRFPPLKGVAPQVQPRTAGKSGLDTYLLVYKHKVEVSPGKRMPYWARVVVDERGKIIKISSSR